MGYQYERDTFKMEIILNDEAIEADGLNVDSYHEAVDNHFTSHGLVKDPDGLFYGQGDKSDFARFGAAVVNFENLDWFNLRHIESWHWYEVDDFTDEDVKEYLDSDVIESYKKYFPHKEVSYG